MTANGFPSASCIFDRPMEIVVRTESIQGFIHIYIYDGFTPRTPQIRCQLPWWGARVSYSIVSIVFLKRIQQLSFLISYFLSSPCRTTRLMLSCPTVLLLCSVKYFFFEIFGLLFYWLGLRARCAPQAAHRCLDYYCLLGFWNYSSSYRVIVQIY